MVGVAVGMAWRRHGIGGLVDGCSWCPVNGCLEAYPMGVPGMPLGGPSQGAMTSKNRPFEVNLRCVFRRDMIFGILEMVYDQGAKS